VTLFLWEIGGEDSTHRCAADIETPGDLGFADAGTVELSDLAGLFSYSHGPAEMLSLEPRFGNAGSDSLAEDLVLERSKHRQQTRHGPTRSASSDPALR
jgi:hypothetical protein